MGTSMLGYSRVSTEEQADSRAGLDAQEHAIRDEAKRRGWEVTMLSDPGKSGKFVNPQLRKALELLAAGQADGLIVSKWTDWPGRSRTLSTSSTSPRPKAGRSSCWTWAWTSRPQQAAPWR